MFNSLTYDTLPYNVFYVVYFVLATVLFLFIWGKRCVITNEVNIVEDNVFSYILCMYLNPKKHLGNIIGWFNILFFSAWGAFRPLSVPDTLNYWYIYKAIKRVPVTFTGVFSRVKIVDCEFGFSLLTKLFAEKGAPYFLYLFVVGLVVNITTVYGLKFICEYLDPRYKYDCGTIFALFSVFLCLHNAFIAIRAGLSIGFGIYAIGIYLKYNKKILSLLLIILSLLFQSMGVAFIAILFLLWFPSNWTRGYILFTWLVSLGLVVTRLPGHLIRFVILGLKYVTSILHISAFDQYLFVPEVGGVPINIYFRIFTLGLMLLIFFRDDNRYYKIALIVSVGIFFQSLFYPVEGLYRVMEYFFMFIIPIVAVDMRHSSSLLVANNIGYFLYYIFLIMQIRLCYAPENVGEINVFSLIT